MNWDDYLNDVRFFADTHHGKVIREGARVYSVDVCKHLPCPYHEEKAQRRLDEITIAREALGMPMAAEYT